MRSREGLSARLFTMEIMMTQESEGCPGVTERGQAGAYKCRGCSLLELWTVDPK